MRNIYDYQFTTKLNIETWNFISLPGHNKFSAKNYCVLYYVIYWLFKCAQNLV